MKINIHGLCDLHVGKDDNEPLPDWRKSKAIQSEPEDHFGNDDEDQPTPPEVIAFLGSDPDDWDDVKELSLGPDEPRKGWIGVDLDGTLAIQNDLEKFNPDVIGPPVKPMIAKVKHLLDEGLDVRIFTARVAGQGALVEKQKKLISEWCKKYLGKELPITNKKDPDCMEIWDDRARRVGHNKGLILSVPIEL